MVIAANFAKCARLKAGGRFVKFRACFNMPNFAKTYFVTATEMFSECFCIIQCSVQYTFFKATKGSNDS